MSEEPRRRALMAVLVPLVALAGMAVYLWGMSRILLATDVNVAPVIALLFALNILVGAALAAGFPKRRGVVATMVAGIMVPVIAVGVVGAAVGEREFHPAVAEEAPAEEPPEEPPAPDEEAPPEEPDAPAEPAAELTIAADNIQFDTDALSAPAQTQVEVVFDNREPVPHNVAFYTDESAAEEIFVGEIFPGPDERTETFTTPGPGTYFFRCDVHPGTMTGTLAVE